MVGRDDGEFELILGNKQLLSVLFIVIVLLGVFFAMGFLAGRSTGSGAEVARKDADQVPISVDAATAKTAEPQAPPPVAQPAAAETPAAAAAASPEEPAAAKQPAGPAAAQPAPVAPPKAAPAKAAEASKPAAAAAAPAAPAPAAAAGGFTPAPPAGTYLQVAAIRRADAESMLSYIGEKTRLHGYVTPVPKSSETFRVVIGPLKTNEDLADARTKLAEIGIKTPYPVKY